MKTVVKNLVRPGILFEDTEPGKVYLINRPPADWLEKSEHPFMRIGNKNQPMIVDLVDGHVYFKTTIDHYRLKFLECETAPLEVTIL